MSKQSKVLAQSATTLAEPGGEPLFTIPELVQKYGRTSGTGAVMTYRGEKALCNKIAQHVKSALGISKDGRLPTDVFDQIKVETNRFYDGLWEQFRLNYVLTRVRFDQPSVKWESKESSTVKAREWKASITGRRDIRNLADDCLNCGMLARAARTRWESMIERPGEFEQSELVLANARAEKLEAEYDRLLAAKAEAQKSAEAEAEKAQRAKLREERAKSRKASRAARERVAAKKVAAKLEAAKPKKAVVKKSAKK